MAVKKNIDTMYAGGEQIKEFDASIADSVNRSLNASEKKIRDQVKALSAQEQYVVALELPVDIMLGAISARYENLKGMHDTFKQLLNNY